jgi:hypothetical protein
MTLERYKNCPLLRWNEKLIIYNAIKTINTEVTYMIPESLYKGLLAESLRSILTASSAPQSWPERWDQTEICPNGN